MSKELPLYKRPIKTNQEPKFTVEKWTKSTELYDEKKYKESIVEVINYINSNLLKGISHKEEINLETVHGICKVNININSETFKIRATMVEVTDETNLVALLRRVAELNFHYSDIEYIVYKDNQLYYEFEDKIELCEPNKVYYTSRDIVLSADRYANEFITYYGAKELEGLNKQELSPKELDESISQIRAYLNEYTQYVDFFTSNSKDGYVWDISTITLLKLSNMTHLNGVYKDEIIAKISTLYNGDLKFDYRVERARKYINTLQELTDEDFKKVLFHRNDIFSMLKLASNDNIKKKLESYEERLLKYERDDNHYAISYDLQELFLKILYTYNVENTHKNLIEKRLLATSKADVKSASKEYVELYNKLRGIDFDTKPKEPMDYVIKYWWQGLFIGYIIVRSVLDGK